MGRREKETRVQAQSRPFPSPQRQLLARATGSFSALHTQLDSPPAPPPQALCCISDSLFHCLCVIRLARIGDSVGGLQGGRGSAGSHSRPPTKRGLSCVFPASAAQHRPFGITLFHCSRAKGRKTDAEQREGGVET